MTDFGRSDRQNAIWSRLGEIRVIVDSGLLGPDAGEYDGDDGELQTEWEALVVEYVAIHTANETRG